MPPTSTIHSPNPLTVTYRGLTHNLLLEFRLENAGGTPSASARSSWSRSCLLREPRVPSPSHEGTAASPLPAASGEHSTNPIYAAGGSLWCGGGRTGCCVFCRRVNRIESTIRSTIGRAFRLWYSRIAKVQRPVRLCFPFHSLLLFLLLLWFSLAIFCRRGCWIVDPTRMPSKTRRRCEDLRRRWLRYLYIRSRLLMMASYFSCSSCINARLWGGGWRRG